MRGVRPPEPRWLAYAALSMVVIVACFAVIMFSQRLEVGSGASTILTAAHLPGASHAYDGSDGHPTQNGYPAVPAEEAEAGDKDPVNAQLLTALLLVVVVGAALGVLLGGKLLLRRILLSQASGDRPPPPFDRLSPQRPAAPLLSVFRL